MTTAVATAVDSLERDKLDLLKRTLCKGLTDDELDLFAQQCKRTGLDPFSRQIYAMKRKNKRDGTETLTIQTGIDGFRAIAARTGELDGQDGPYWCGPDGVWVDVWLKEVPPAAAKVVVYRKGSARGFVGVARFNEYAQRYPSGDLSGLWGKMPATMNAKCAEALALRKAFPNDLGGLYTSEEMQQADEPEEEPKPARGKRAAALAAPADDTKALPPKAEAGPVEAVVEGDPITDVSALTALALAKGWDYVGVLKSINDRFGASHSLTRTRWIEIPREQREQTVAALQMAKDKPKEPAPSVEELQRLVGEVSRLMKLEPCEVFGKLLQAKGWEGVGSYDDLRTTQLAEAVKGMRVKLASLQPKPEAEPKPAAV